MTSGQQQTFPLIPIPIRLVSPAVIDPNFLLYLLTKYRVTSPEVDNALTPCICYVCGKDFKSKYTLKRHLKQKHEAVGGQNAFPCSVLGCSKSFPDSSRLQRHLRTHSGEKPYECEVCKKRFSDSSNMKKHKLIHSKRPSSIRICPYDTCLRTYVHKGHFNKHLASHKNEEEKAFLV